MTDRTILPNNAVPPYCGKDLFDENCGDRFDGAVGAWVTIGYARALASQIAKLIAVRDEHTKAAYYKGRDYGKRSEFEKREKLIEGFNQRASHWKARAITAETELRAIRRGNGGTADAAVLGAADASHSGSSPDSRILEQIADIIEADGSGERTSDVWAASSVSYERGLSRLKARRILELLPTIQSFVEPQATSEDLFLDGTSDEVKDAAREAALPYSNPHSRYHFIFGFSVGVHWRNKQAKGPTVVTLCGSTRFYPVWQQAIFDETMAGRIVLSVGFYPHAADKAHAEGVGVTPAQKEALDELHKRKIDISDEILVLNEEGYIGDSTRSEIAYAKAQGKKVRWLHPELV